MSGECQGLGLLPQTLRRRNPNLPACRTATFNRSTNQCSLFDKAMLWFPPTAMESIELFGPIFASRYFSPSEWAIGVAGNFVPLTPSSARTTRCTAQRAAERRSRRMRPVQRCTDARGAPKTTQGWRIGIQRGGKGRVGTIGRLRPNFGFACLSLLDCIGPSVAVRGQFCGQLFCLTSPTPAFRYLASA